MIPLTIHGLAPFECISALQKFIRRGMEVEAMEVAVEMIHTSKAFNTMVCNRLIIISHEDIDTQLRPDVISFVAASAAMAKEGYNPDNMKQGKSRMAIGNAIRLMCRAPKSREGDHFQAAIGLSNLIEGKAPVIPDWIHDQHTTKGKAQGRGVEYFRTVSTVLYPQPKKDPYEDEAYRLWTLKAGGLKPPINKKSDLFDIPINREN